MERILNFIDNISEMTGKIFCWITSLLALLVVSEVILRRFFGSPTIWSFEVTKPSLHDIFVRIAGPEAREAENAQDAQNS